MEKLKPLVIEQSGEISKEKAELLSRKLTKLLSNPEFFAVVDAIVKQQQSTENDGANYQK